MINPVYMVPIALASHIISIDSAAYFLYSTVAVFCML